MKSRASRAPGRGSPGMTLLYAICNYEYIRVFVRTIKFLYFFILSLYSSIRSSSSIVVPRGWSEARFPDPLCANDVSYHTAHMTFLLKGDCDVVFCLIVVDEK